MPKFYVSSGDLEVACDSDVPKNAAIAAFNRLKDLPIKQLGKLTLVSEHSFNSGHDDDTYFITGDLLEETDQIEDFVSGEWIE